MKRKVILYIAQSLDGCVARKDGSLDWLPQPESMSKKTAQFYETFFADIDTILMGKNTYDQVINVLSPEQWPYPNTKSYVWTTKSNTPVNDTIQFTQTDLKNFIEQLQTEEGKNIWILGGGDFAAQCIVQNLIDEYIITTIPVILGSGIALFPTESPVSQKLIMKNCLVGDQMIQIEYTVIE